MHILNLLLGSILLRPYVYIFMLLFLIAATLHLGGRRTLLLTAVAWITALGCELSSTRNGFPFGLYHYTEHTRGQELFISNVPFFDSLSFTFLAYAAFSLALFFTAPLERRGWDVRLIDLPSHQRSCKVLCLSVLFFVLVDIVTDANAVRGSRWFLGNIFWYHHQGVYFGVPLSNFAGWCFVGGVSIAVYQQLEKQLRPGRGWGNLAVPGKALFGPALYACIVIFNIVISFIIGEIQLGLASTFIMLPIFALFLIRLFDPRAQATEAEIEAYQQLGQDRA